MTQAIPHSKQQSITLLESRESRTLTTRCPACSSFTGQWRGYVQRQQGRVVYHRRWCKQCGKWFYGSAAESISCVTDEDRREHLAYDAWIEAFQEAQEEPAK